MIRPALQLALLFLVLAGGHAQVVVDRMAAVVNKRVIMESELDQTARVEYLIQGKPLSSGKLEQPELVAVLDQLIDRSLLEQQIVHDDLVAPSQVELGARLQEVRQRLPGAKTDDAWKALLAAYGVTQQDVENYLGSEFRVLRMIDLRFRGLVHVEPAAVTSYYQEKLVPELVQRGAAQPPLADVSNKIEKILIEQRLDEMQNDWLQTLRAQARIERLLTAVSQPAGGAHP